MGRMNAHWHIAHLVLDHAPPSTTTVISVQYDWCNLLMGLSSLWAFPPFTNQKLPWLQRGTLAKILQSCNRHKNARFHIAVFKHTIFRTWLCKDHQGNRRVVRPHTCQPNYRTEWLYSIANAEIHWLPQYCSYGYYTSFVQWLLVLGILVTRAAPVVQVLLIFFS